MITFKVDAEMAWWEEETTVGRKGHPTHFVVLDHDGNLLIQRVSMTHPAPANWEMT